MSPPDRPNLDRRAFLAGAGALATLAAAPRALPASPASDGPRHLVAVFLNGGNDGLNTLVPFADDRYRHVRPNLALKRDAVLRIDAANGLHPSLARLARRFEAGGVGFLRGVGYEPPNLSHFTSRDVWESARLDFAGARTGWIGRMVDRRLPDGPGAGEPSAMIAVGGVTAPLAMLAERNEPYAVPDVVRFRVRGAPPASSTSESAARLRALEELNRPDTAGRAARVAGSVEGAAASIARLERALEREPRAEYPDDKLARDLGIVARSIDAELPALAFHVSQHGYDTHAAQRDVHAELLATLDGALDAFLRDLEACGKLERTLVMVFSEFGRRVAENGIRDHAGTDHGAAGLAMLLGGGARPGIHGAEPDLEALDDAGNLVPTTDFRALYADVIAGWFGEDPAAVLGGDFGRAGVVRP